MRRCPSNRSGRPDEVEAAVARPLGLRRPLAFAWISCSAVRLNGAEHVPPTSVLYLRGDNANGRNYPERGGASNPWSEGVLPPATSLRWNAVADRLFHDRSPRIARVHWSRRGQDVEDR